MPEITSAISTGTCGTCGSIQDIELCVVPNRQAIKMSWAVHHEGPAVFCPNCAAEISIPEEPQLEDPPTIMVLNRK